MSIFWLERNFRIYGRSEEHTPELQSLMHLVCRLLLQKKRALSSSATPLYRRDRPGGDAAAFHPLPLPAALPISVCSVRAAQASTPLPGAFFNDTATTDIYTLSLHDALPI